MTETRSDARIVRHALLSAASALDLQLPKPLRAYSFEFDIPTQTVWLRAEVDRELTEDEREDLSVAETEVMAQEILGWVDRTKYTMVLTEISVVPLGQPLDPLPRGIAFLREGEPIPDNYPGAPPHPDAWKPRPTPV